jgi:hypothetical protein
MSSLEGYNPEESILAGGEGVPINPSQAGGAIQIGGNPYDNLTVAERERVKMAAAAAYAIAYKRQKTDVNITNDDLNNAAIDAAGTEGKAIMTEKVANANGEILNDEDISPTENAAAQKAVELIIPTLSTDPKDAGANKKKIEETAIKAILLERRNNKLKAVATQSTKETSMITALAHNIIALKEYPVYTEFYNIIGENDNIYNSIYHTRYNQIRDKGDAGLKRIQQTMYIDIDKYKNQRLKQWNSVYKTSGGKVSPIIPIVNETSISDKEIFTLFSRFIYCLPYDHERVVIIPPIRGNPTLFINTLYRLQKIGAISYKKVAGKDVYKIKRDTSLIFMPPFYRGLDKEININKEINLTLFTIFIDFNKTNPNQIFILSESTAQNFAVGTFLSIIFSNANALKNVPLTMLEPSYITYPYKRSGLQDGFIISSSTDAEKVNIPTEGKNELGSLYTNKEYGKALGLAVKPVTVMNANPPFADGSPTTLTIRTGNFKPLKLEESQLSKETPTGPCAGLLNSPNLNLFPTTGTKQFIFNKITIGTSTQPRDAILVIQLNSKGTHVSLCNTAVSEGLIPLSSDDRHNPTEGLSTEGNNIQIFTKGNIYSIRESSNEVKKDWKDKKFTKDEAEFLNRTRLLPGVLDAVFGGSWTERLAIFLDTLSASKCMTDTALLTKHECHYNRDFLEQVHAYFVNNTLQMNLIHDEETRRREEELQKYTDELYGDDTSGPVTSISAIQVREANDAEKENHKMKFGTISSYVHKGNAEHPANERRALVIGVNKKSGLYKFYIVSTPSEGADSTKAMDDEKLIQIVKEELPRKYKDFIFIY